MSDLDLSAVEVLVVEEVAAPTLAESALTLLVAQEDQGPTLLESQVSALVAQEFAPAYDLSQVLLLVWVEDAVYSNISTGVGDLLRRIAIPTPGLDPTLTIGIYTNWPTAGGMDGSPVSSAHTYEYPLRSGRLYHKINAIGRPVKCALRCSPGIKSDTDTTIGFSGANKRFWQLAPDSGQESPGAWGGMGQALVVGQVVDTNLIFWARARCELAEVWQEDMSVDLYVTGKLSV